MKNISESISFLKSFLGFSNLLIDTNYLISEELIKCRKSCFEKSNISPIQGGASQKDLRTIFSLQPLQM